MTKHFVTSYIDGYGKKRIFFYPGKDAYGKPTAKLTIIENNINYKFTRNDDGGINYILNSNEEVSVKLNDMINNVQHVIIL